MWNRGLLKILNGIKLILDGQENHFDSYTISLESFRSFRGLLFHKPVTGQEFFFAVSYSKPALTAFSNFSCFFYYRRFRFDSRYDIFFNLSQGMRQGKFSHVSNSISNRKANRKTHGRFWRPYFTSQFFSSLPYTCGLPPGL